MLHQSLLNSPEEVVVESRIDEQDEDFGCPIPVLVDVDISGRWRSAEASYRFLDEVGQERSLTHVSFTGGFMWAGIQMQNTATLMAVMTPAVPHFSSRMVLWRSAMTDIRLMIICMSSWISKTQKKRKKKSIVTLASHGSIFLFVPQNHKENQPSIRVTYNSLQEKPSKDSDAEIGEDFAPYHVDICASKWVLVEARLLDGLPNGQEAKADGKPSSQRGNLDVAL